MRYILFLVIFVGNVAYGQADVVAIVVPGFNEIENVEALFTEIERVAVEHRDKVKFEVVFIDDGSTDGTFKKLKEIQNQFKSIKVHPLQNAENMGQGKSIMRGLKFVHEKIKSSTFTATIDADMQNPPSNIVTMLEVAKVRGSALVVGFRKDRNDSIIRKLMTQGFFIVRYLALPSRVRHAGGQRLMRTELIPKLESLPKIRNGHLFISDALVMAGEVDIHEVNVEHRARLAGKPKFGLGSSLGVACSTLYVGAKYLPARLGIGHSPGLVSVSK